MGWTAKQHRRARYLKGLEDWVKSAALAGEDRVKEEWSRLVLAKMPPITFMGLFTFPERFGSADRRRWTYYQFMEEWSGQGNYLAAEEPHQKGDIHFHAVGADHLRHLSMHDAWEVATRCGPEKRGGFARIEAPRCMEDAVGYCVKYVSKGYLSGQCDLRIGSPAEPEEDYLVRRGFLNPKRPREPGKGKRGSPVRW